jgi:hypothetical protein
LKDFEKEVKKSHGDTKYLAGWARKDFVTHDKYVYKRVLKMGDRT